jgi:hypothetical protein
VNHAFHWSALKNELDLWQDAGRKARFWLRDDDACEPTTALDALVFRLKSHDAPCLLAVIPMRAGEELASMFQNEPLIRIAMHGVWHNNHAPKGRKSEETPVERGLDTIMTELSAARARHVRHFGEAAGDWYVPPWNRIGNQVAAELSKLGFSVLSTFAHNSLEVGNSLRQLNTDVDLIDWKGGRIGRPSWSVESDIVAHLARSRQKAWGPVGILTHHLVHDDQAWSVMDELFETVSRHPAAVWSNPDSLL